MDVIIDVFLTWLAVMVVCVLVLGLFYFKGDMMLDWFKHKWWQWYG